MNPGDIHTISTASKLSRDTQVGRELPGRETGPGATLRLEAHGPMLGFRLHICQILGVENDENVGLLWSHVGRSSKS